MTSIPAALNNFMVRRISSEEILSHSVRTRKINTRAEGCSLLLNDLRTFALIVCAQPFCTGNATAICHASLRLTGPEDKHGVENTGEKNFRPSLLLWIIGDPYFFNHESLTLLTIYKI